MFKFASIVSFLLAGAAFAAEGKVDLNFLFGDIDLDRDTIVTNCDPTIRWQESGNLMSDPGVKRALNVTLAKKLAPFSRAVVAVIEMPCVLQVDPRNAPSEAGGRALLISTKKETSVKTAPGAK